MDPSALRAYTAIALGVVIFCLALFWLIRGRFIGMPAHIPAKQALNAWLIFLVTAAVGLGLIGLSLFRLSLI